MRPIHLTGLGFWSPGFADVTAWREGRPDAAVDKPRCRLVDPRLKRGSSRFSNMLGEVVEQAATAAGLDVRTVPTIYGSSLGEIETMCILLKMLWEEEGKLSPNRFKNSVHNAASGLVSIGTVNTSFSTAIAGGDRTFETSLLEAWAYLLDAGGSAIVAIADDKPPEPLDSLGDYGPLAVGFALSADPVEGALRLSDLRRASGPIAAHARVPEELAPNCAAACLELLDAALARRAGTVSLALPGRAGMCVDVEL